MLRTGLGLEILSEVLKILLAEVPRTKGERQPLLNAGQPGAKRFHLTLLVKKPAVMRKQIDRRVTLLSRHKLTLKRKLQKMLTVLVHHVGRQRVAFAVKRSNHGNPFNKRVPGPSGHADGITQSVNGVIFAHHVVRSEVTRGIGLNQRHVLALANEARVRGNIGRVLEFHTLAYNFTNNFLPSIHIKLEAVIAGKAEVVRVKKVAHLGDNGDSAFGRAGDNLEVYPKVVTHDVPAIAAGRSDISGRAGDDAEDDAVFRQTIIRKRSAGCFINPARERTPQTRAQSGDGELLTVDCLAKTILDVSGR